MNSAACEAVHRPKQPMRTTLITLSIMLAFIAGFIVGVEVETNYCKSYYSRSTQ